MAPAAAAHPASGPASAPSTGPAIDEDDLPVEVVELPGNKVRIIWVLRSFGGSNVTTTRDGGTSRRTVAVAPPDLAPLVAVLAPSVGAGGVVTPLPKENTLVITCDRSMRGPVIDLLSRLDVPRPAGGDHRPHLRGVARLRLPAGVERDPEPHRL